MFSKLIKLMEFFSTSCILIFNNNNNNNNNNNGSNWSVKEKLFLNPHIWVMNLARHVLSMFEENKTKISAGRPVDFIRP